MKVVVVGLAVLIAVAQPAHGSPRSDLASPSQGKRDAAAAKLRTTFKPTPRSKLEHLVTKIKKPGMKKKQALALLRPFKPQMEAGGAGGGGETVLYRIDDSWLIECSWSDRGDDTVFGAELVASTRSIFVEPPKKYTGVWTTYYVNGQRSNEIHYKDGRYDGTFTSFHDDGSTAVVQHYGPNGADGDDTGYHPNGKVAYRGAYKDGKQVGVWTWYDETGKVTSTKQY